LSIVRFLDFWIPRPIGLKLKKTLLLILIFEEPMTFNPQAYPLWIDELTTDDASVLADSNLIAALKVSI